MSLRIFKPITCLVLFVTAVFASTLPASTQEANTGASGLPLPRYVAIDSNRANMRTGPGQQYPILWVFVRQNLPLQVFAEYDVWRRVRGPEGATGWIHSALLTNRRSALVTGGTRILHASLDPGSRAVIRAEAGVTGRIESCRSGWCELDVQGRSGWIRIAHIWGVDSDEVID